MMSYNVISMVCFRPWPTPRNWQERWFIFSHCEFSIYTYKCSNMVLVVTIPPSFPLLWLMMRSPDF